ncbi:hypothetical protein EJ04DRAFT_564840 [Polyplosphaeria fusca]|uniref:Uncharacterized protein n=1 Tax=Polyplosphaeria fusca TaxID=682080 RepID=A0A9P4V2V6_9PLEO|nr:hypothetical protein EJ04DRAFT_564840 [Polyplosphaeria fusca]
MQRSLAALLLVADPLWHVAASTLTARAIEPTATGQIGVNPPEEFGDPSEYVAHIGVDTQYLTEDGTTTKWIGVNDEYLTMISTTVTVEDRPVISTIPVEISASTATASATGVDPGDVTVLLSDKFRAALEQEIKDAAISCGAVAKARKRQSETFTTCMIQAGQTSVEAEGSAFDLVAPGTWESFEIKTSDNLAPEIIDLLSWVGDRVAKNKLRIFMGGAVAMGVGAGIAVSGEDTKPMPPKVKFPGGALGGANAIQTPPAPGTPTTTGCTPSDTVNADSPVCDSKKDDCQGRNRKCTQGKYKDCPCSDWTYPVHEDTYDYEFGDEQQKLLAEYLKDLPDDVPPSCFRNTNGDLFDGKPAAEPSAWCVCTSGTSSGIYSTVTSTESPCALKSMPTKTISITKAPKVTGPVTSCKWTTMTYESTTVDPFCTCNDNRMHGVPVETTTVEDGKTKTICVAPDSEPTRPVISTLPSPENPACFGVVESSGYASKKFLKDDEDVEAFVKQTCEVDIGTTFMGTVRNVKEIDTTDGKGNLTLLVNDDHPHADRPCGDSTRPAEEIKDVSKEKCIEYLMSSITKCSERDEGSDSDADYGRGGFVQEECFTWSVRIFSDLPLQDPPDGW